MKCPQCDREMEHGYLSIPPSGLAFNTEWLSEKQEFGFKANTPKRDTIAPAGLWGIVQIEGYRCRECSLIILHSDRVTRV